MKPILKRYRVAIVTNTGFSRGESFDTPEAYETWLLAQMELSEGVKYYRILDREVGKVIEDENGKRDKKKNVWEN